MASVDEDGRRDDVDGSRSNLDRLLDSSFFKICLSGVATVLLGKFVLDGTIAGMFGIWGATAALIGAVGLGLHYIVYNP